MNMFRYETHLHTSEASACATYTAAQHVNSYRAAGYEGIVVTDHFFNGKSCVPKNLPWNERGEQFYKGYENAKMEGDRIGLSVFFGWEATFDTTDFLIYGLDKEWLLEQPDILSWTMKEQYQKVHEAGGLVIHAHPFRIRPYIHTIRLVPDCVDAVEVINVGNNNKEFDQKAYDYAQKYNFPMTAGTDAHSKEPFHSGIEFPYKINNIEELIFGIKNKKQTLITTC